MGIPLAKPLRVSRGSARDLKHRVREKEAGKRGKVVKVHWSDGVGQYNDDYLLVERSRSHLREFSGIVEACV